MKFSTLLQIPAKVQRNQDVLKQLARVATAGSAEERIAALDEIEIWLANKYLELRRRPPTAAVGTAAKLLADPRVASQLSALPHLGTLAPLSRIDARRMDYVAFQIELLRQLKDQSPGLGLGSNSGTRELTGLDLAQTWAVVLSAGHLFGTFATARALRFQIDESPDIANTIARSCDESLRPSALGWLRSGSVYDATKALAALWVSCELPTGAVRSSAIQALAEYSRNELDSRRQRIRYAHKIARQIAFLRLHEAMRLGTSVHPLETELVRELLLGRGIAFEPHAMVDSHARRLLDILSSFQYRTLFSSPRAATLVLAHMREFKVWWANQHAESVPIVERIKKLRTRPDDWPQSHTPLPGHLVRLELPCLENEVVQEVRSWRGNTTAWQNSAFFISSNPEAGEVICDIFADHPLDAKCAGHVSALLAKHCAQSWRAEEKASTRALWESIALWTVTLLRNIVLPGFDFVIRPAAAQNPSVGFAVAGDSRAEVERRLGTFLNRISDTGRKTELETLQQMIVADDSEGTWIVVLGSTLVVDNRTGKPVKELDGVWAVIREDGIRWSFLENKSGKTAGASKQLSELQKFVSVPLTKPTNQRLVGNAAWVVTATWPKASDSDG